MQDASDIMLSAYNVQFAAGGRQIIRGATFEVGRGENFLVLASSGAGKTTLMKRCAGILAPDKGAVLVEGQDLALLSPEAKRDLRMRLRFIFEEGVLLNNLTLM